MSDNNMMSEILIYQSEDGETHIDVRLENETVWLSQLTMAELFQISKQTISHHLKNIYQEGELGEEATVKYYLTVQNEGERQVNRKLQHYNLEAIIAVGYRVRSHRGTQFRRWATERLTEYLQKGFVMDDERLKNIGTPFGTDYFDELLERIRDIRASEKRFYRKITDIYATSVDYDSKSEPAQTFFQTVQNKLHWATTGHTAAELIAERADATKPNMGLTTWKGANVRKPAVTIAKNYLSEDEIKNLNRIVTMYLDYAEDQAQRRQAMSMAEWATKLDAFLQFNEREVLDHAGNVKAEVAKQLALDVYDEFHGRRLVDEVREEGDEFERVVKGIEEHGGES